MSCPTCDHTMAMIVNSPPHSFHHCPRCGTVKHNTHGHSAFSVAAVYVPTLVERCRKFATTQIGCGDNAALWNRLGIAESINLPADRT